MDNRSKSGFESSFGACCRSIAVNAKRAITAHAGFENPHEDAAQVDISSVASTDVLDGIEFARVRTAGRKRRLRQRGDEEIFRVRLARHELPEDEPPVARDRRIRDERRDTRLHRGRLFSPLERTLERTRRDLTDFRLFGMDADEKRTDRLGVEEFQCSAVTALLREQVLPERLRRDVRVRRRREERANEGACVFGVREETVHEWPTQRVRDDGFGPGDELGDRQSAERRAGRLARRPADCLRQPGDYLRPLEDPVTLAQRDLRGGAHLRIGVRQRALEKRRRLLRVAREEPDHRATNLGIRVLRETLDDLRREADLGARHGLQRRGPYVRRSVGEKSVEQRAVALVERALDRRVLEGVAASRIPDPLQLDRFESVRDRRAHARVGIGELREQAFGSRSTRQFLGRDGAHFGRRRVQELDEERLHRRSQTSRIQRPRQREVETLVVGTRDFDEGRAERRVERVVL